MEYKQIWRFYLSSSQTQSDEQGTEQRLFELSSEESHFAYSVLRLSQGERVELADGSGWTADATLTRCDKKSVIACILREKKLQNPQKKQFALVGMTKPGALEELVQACVEAGVWELILYKGDRTSSKQELKHEKIAKQVREICRITKSPWLMNVKFAESLSAAVRLLRSGGCESKLLICDERPAHDGLGFESLPHLLKEISEINTDKLAFVVGPEASFSEKEYEFLSNEESQKRAGFVTLGPRILRTPAAVAAAAYVMSAHLEVKPPRKI